MTLVAVDPVRYARSEHLGLGPVWWMHRNDDRNRNGFRTANGWAGMGDGCGSYRSHGGGVFRERDGVRRFSLDMGLSCRPRTVP